MKEPTRKLSTASPDSTAGLIAEDRRSLWHPFTQTAEWLSYDPIVVESADGFFLVASDGRRYLDGVSSIWCNVHGHGHPAIVAAMKEQLDRVSHSTLLGLSHVPAITLAKHLTEITPDGLTRVFYSDSGSTAVEVALRMAFQYWRQKGQEQRTRFVSLADAYHGDTLGAVSLGRSHPFHTGYEPITFEVLKFRPPFLCPPHNGSGHGNLEEAARASLAELEQLLDSQGEQIAAVVIEPLVQGAAGIWPQPPSFVAGLRQLCDRFGVLMIADEVATGFGRTTSMFAVEQAGVCPDIMCLAKGLTAGYLPLAATLASEEIYQAFSAPYEEYKTLFHGHTYGGNPLGCAAAIANLKVFSDEAVLETCRRGAAVFADLLDRYIGPLAEAGQTGPPRQVGMMAAFDLTAGPGTPHPPAQRRAHRAVLAAREQGVIIRPLADCMVLMPPLTIPADLLERLVATTAEAVVEASK